MNPRTQFEMYTGLKTIELWESQRDPNINLINSIVDSQLLYFKEHNYFIFPSAIIIAEFSKNYYIIDGQHRLGAMKFLYETYKHDIGIAVVFYECKTKKDVDELYAMINNVNTNNCMTIEGVMTNNGKKIKTIHKLLKENYGVKIWDDKRLTKPYVNLNCLDKELETCGYLLIYSADEIFDQIKIKNDNYKKTLSKQTLKEIEKYGPSFCSFFLQYKEPKARWVRSLF
jgi:hypothetical protein